MIESTLPKCSSFFQHSFLCLLVFSFLFGIFFFLISFQLRKYSTISLKGKVRSMNEIFLSIFVLSFSFLFSIHFFSTQIWCCSQFSLFFICNDFRAFSSHHYLYVILYFIFFGKFSRFYYLLNTFQSNKNKKESKA